MAVAEVREAQILASEQYLLQAFSARSSGSVARRCACGCSAHVSQATV